MEFTFSFLELFLRGVELIFPILLFFALLIVVLGQVVGRIEGWNAFDSFYWSFITAMTVGYGDIRPLKRSAKTLSLVIALLGVMFTGVIVALTVTTATDAFRAHVDASAIVESQGKDGESVKR